MNRLLPGLHPNLKHHLPPSLHSDLGGLVDQVDPGWGGRKNEQIKVASQASLVKLFEVVNVPDSTHNSRKCSLVQNFTEKPPNPPEEIYAVFIFTKHEPFKPHPYQMISTPFF